MANAPHAWDNQGWQDSNNDGTWDTANTGWNASGQAGGGSTALTAPRPQAHADNVGWPSDRQLGASNSGPHAREVTGARTSISGGPTLQAKVNTANRPHACENPSNASNTQPHAWEAGPTSPVKPHAWESTSQSRRTSHAWEGENDNPPSPTRRVYRGPPPPRNDNVRLFDIDEYARELGMLCLHQGEFDIAVSEVPEPYPKIGNPPVLEQMTVRSHLAGEPDNSHPNNNLFYFQYADLMQLARRTESGPDLSERQKDEVPRKARNYMRSQRQTDGSRSASPLAQNITDAKRNDSVQGRPNTSYADQMATTALAKGKSKSTEDIDLTVETGDRTGGTFADEMELRKREKETEQRMLEKEMGERKMEKGKFKSTADIISAAAEGDVLKSSDEDVKPVAVRVPPRNDGGLFTPMKAGAAMFPAVELHQSPVASGGAGARPAESAAPTHAGPVQEPRQPAHFDPAIQQCGQLIWNVSQHYIAGKRLSRNAITSITNVMCILLFA